MHAFRGVARGADGYNASLSVTWPSFSGDGNCVCSAPDATGAYALLPSTMGQCAKIFQLFNKQVCVACMGLGMGMGMGLGAGSRGVARLSRRSAPVPPR